MRLTFSLREIDACDGTVFIQFSVRFRSGHLYHWMLYKTNFVYFMIILLCSFGFCTIECNLCTMWYAWPRLWSFTVCSFTHNQSCMDFFVRNFLISVLFCVHFLFRVCISFSFALSFSYILWLLTIKVIMWVYLSHVIAITSAQLLAECV